MSHLVLLSGLLCDHRLWRAQIEALGGQMNIWTPDLSKHESIPALATHVLQQVPERFALAGLSMGGYVAFEIMRQAPERVTRLALFDTTARPDTEEQRERRRGLLWLAKTGKFKGVTPRLLPMILHPDRLEDKAVTEVVFAMAADVGRTGFQNQQTAILNRIDSRPALPHIPCPTLVAGGRQDALTPPELMQEIAAHIPQATHEIIEHCGHLAPLEQPETVTRLMKKWLSA